ITIPIGVWKDGSLRFEPELPAAKQRALTQLEVGHVVKIVFRFRERFWDERPFNFLHARDRFLPTWWTAAPARAAMLTGWAGGHAADSLLAEGEASLVDRALESMASALGEKRRTIEELLIG